MLTTPFRDSVLGSLGGYIGLLKTITSFRTPTVGEADYTGYGTRPAWSPTAAADTTPAGGRYVENDAEVAFPQNTGGTQDVIGFGVFDADTGGNLDAIGLLDTDPPVVGTAAATGDLVEAPAHGLEADQRVFVLAFPGALLPAGLSEGTAYFVLAAGLTADAFALSTTSGGSAVDITAKGAAMFLPYKAVTIAGSATPAFAAGAFVVEI